MKPAVIAALAGAGALLLLLGSSGAASAVSRSLWLPYSGPLSEVRWTQEQKLAAADPRLRLPELLARLRARGWQPMIAFSWRSLATQAALVRLGRSTVDFSFHNALDAAGRPAALAVDLYDARYGWGDEPGTARTAGAAAFFAVVGAEAKALGLSWGGDWSRSTPLWAAFGLGWDPGHVQGLPNDQLPAVKLASIAAAQRATARA